MDLYVFNPENDLALANFGKNFIPPRSALTMRDDLAVLPLWWAGCGDAVLVPSAEAACRFAAGYGGWIPDVQWVSDAAVSGLQAVSPWGWSPLFVNEMRKSGCPDRLLPDDDWLATYRILSGRRQAVDLLEALIRDEAFGRQWRDRLCGRSYYCTSEADIMRCLSAYGDTILKAPWSGSGKGLRLGRGGYVPPLVGWCRRLLEEQGGVVVEPLYDRKFDFAYEYFVEADRVVYKGLSVFATTLRGTYGGNWVAPERVKEKWLSAYVPEDLQAGLRQAQAEWLSRRLCGKYQGWLGIDMMCCVSPQTGGYVVHPCVEINLRRTMGVVSLYLSRYLHPRSQAYFSITYDKRDGALSADHDRQQVAEPLGMEEAKIRKGYLSLTPVYGHTHYRAALHVADHDLSGLIVSE